MSESTILPDAVTAAKSNQLNADDLVGREIEGVITKVILKGIADQPVHVVIDGDEKKPWKPCKGMTRVMRDAWSSDTAHWVGQRVRLFNDQTVKWGGVAVGGIRIRAMSGIDADRTFPVTVSKGVREPMRVRRLDSAAAPKKAEKPAQTAEEKRAKSETWAKKVINDILAGSPEEVEVLMIKHADALTRLRSSHPDLADMVESAKNAAVKE